MSDILIQWLDTCGWTTMRRMDPAGANGWVITNAMRELQEAYPGKRIRAVDDNGRVIDIYS